jgi:hypothetical protein
MADASSQFAVADACMSFTQAINDRHSLMSPDIAQSTGESLFTWFKEQDALNADRSPFAVRSVSMGTSALQTGKPMSVDDIVDMIKSTYEHYTDGL